jgi:hypothetical protein
MSLSLTVLAKADMRRIWKYYDSQLPGLGDEFLSELGIAIRLVRDYPNAQPEFTHGSRRVLLNRFPYGAAYNVEPSGEIVFYIIAHTRRAEKVWSSRL